MKCTKSKVKFLKQELKETKSSLSSIKYKPYRKELKKSVRFWKKELEKCK